MTSLKPDLTLLKRWANTLRATAEIAGRAILDVRANGVEVVTKQDKSPVTQADQIAERIVLAELETLEIKFPIVAEERVAAGQVPALDEPAFWLVDALDGTKEFIKNGKDFTVNIALVYDGVPTLGVVHAPARGETYTGVVDIEGNGRFAEVWRDNAAMPISVRTLPAKVTVVGSRSHEVADDMKAFLSGRVVEKHQAIGSSLKFCLVAEGLADLYPRFGPTCEWDTGAGHAVLRAAGGRVHTFDGKELTYKKLPDFLNGRFLADAGP